MLTPIQAPLNLALEGLYLRDGNDPPTEEDIGDAPLRRRYEHLIDAPDLFPYIDNAARKPNVGRVLYLVLPPRAQGDEHQARAVIGWDLHGIPSQFASWQRDATLLWIDSIEIFRKHIPSLADSVGLPTNWIGTPETLSDLEVQYRGAPGILQDPCRHRSGQFELVGPVPEEPMDLVQGREAWDLYQARIGYVYLQTDKCPNLQNVCEEGSLNPSCTLIPSLTPTPHPLPGTRYQDYYVSLAGPSGAIVEPPEESVCYPKQPDSDPITREVKANVARLVMVGLHFPDYQVQVQIHATGDIAPSVDAPNPHTHWSGWQDVLEVPSGMLVHKGPWYNNRLSNEEAVYKVTLRYRYCHRSSDDRTRCADDSVWVTQDLDTMRIRFDKHDACPDGFQ